MSKSRIKLHVHQQTGLSIMLQMFQRQIFWMSYPPLPKCKFATNLHHICFKQSSAHEKIIGMWEAVLHKHLSCVLQHQGLLRASCMQAISMQLPKPQVWEAYSKGNPPSQSKLQVCCKCSTKLQEYKTLVHLSTNIMNGTHAEKISNKAVRCTASYFVTIIWCFCLFCSPPPHPHLRQCIVVSEGRLMLDIEWFVLF